jgi:hypothetical protein
MPKLHWSLSPIANILFIPLWAVATAVFVWLLDVPGRFAVAITGGLLGISAGLFQHLALVQASDALGGAGSLLEIRRCLKSTPWGRRYIFLLYLSKAIILVPVLVIFEYSVWSVLFAYLSGYFSLMFTREIVTLRDTFRLHGIAARAYELNATKLTNALPSSSDSHLRGTGNP